MDRKECGLWLAISLLTSALFAVGAGVLRWAGDHGVAGAVMYAGATFGGAEMLFLALLGFAITATSRARGRR